MNKQIKTIITKHVLWIFLLMSFAFPFFLLYPIYADGGTYDSGIIVRYAGFVKPQKPLADYNGVVDDDYSTVWRGNYDGNSEGSGRHPGVDIRRGECHTEVRAIAQGTVFRVVKTWQERFPLRNACGNNLGFGTWGNYVIIRHDDLPNREGYQGTTFSAYTHLYTVTDGLEAGGKVLRGTIIGEQGSTGNSSGTHLHFQIDKDRSIRPFNHPYWLGDPDSGDTPLVAQYTYNPMRLIEAHSVETEFDYNLHTEYYSNQNLTEPSSEEYYSETEIDFEWFDSSPIPYGTPAPFSVRWEGRTPFLRQGGWIFYVTTGDGIRLQINNELVIDEWHTQDVGVNTYEYHWLLSSRQRPIVEMEYFDVNNPAVAQLAWQRVPDVYLPIIMKSILLIPTPDPYPFHRK